MLSKRQKISEKRKELDDAMYTIQCNCISTGRSGIECEVTCDTKIFSLESNAMISGKRVRSGVLLAISIFNLKSLDSSGKFKVKFLEPYFFIEDGSEFDLVYNSPDTQHPSTILYNPKTEKSVLIDVVRQVYTLASGSEKAWTFNSAVFITEPPKITSV